MDRYEELKEFYKKASDPLTFFDYTPILVLKLTEFILEEFSEDRFFQEEENEEEDEPHFDYFFEKFEAKLPDHSSKILHFGDCSECFLKGCRELETRCKRCGRLVCTSTQNKEKK